CSSTRTRVRRFRSPTGPTCSRSAAFRSPAAARNCSTIRACSKPTSGCERSRAKQPPAAKPENRMKESLAKGLSTTRKIRIDRDRTIDFMGENARVYATPMLVLDIEKICRELLLEHLDAGEDSVGTRVEVDHLAATLMGMDVELTVTVSEVKGRAVSLEIEGRDSVETICRGKHNRFVVGVDTTVARLAAKAQKAGLA